VDDDAVHRAQGRAVQAIRIALGSADISNLETALGVVRQVVEVDVYRTFGVSRQAEGRRLHGEDSCR
jgi:hypothetical protein